MPNSASSVALAAVALVAGIYDWRFRRIPNWLALAGFVIGFVLNFSLGALAGAVLAFAIYLPLYLLRAVGGGDLKLMTAIGAITGAWPWLVIFLITSLLGGVIAIVMLLTRGRLTRTLLNVVFIIGELIHLRPPYRTRPDLDVQNPASMRLPHAVVIALACGLYLAAQFLR